jgi:hypothetical protein
MSVPVLTSSASNESTWRTPFNLFRTFYMLLFLLLNFIIGILGAVTAQQSRYTVGLSPRSLVFASVVGFISVLFILPTFIFDVLRRGVFKAAFWTELLCLISFICLDLSVVAAAFTLRPGSEAAFCTATNNRHQAVCNTAVALFALVFISGSITFIYLTALIARIALRYHRSIWHQSVREYHWAHPVKREQKILDLFGNTLESPEPQRLSQEPYVVTPSPIPPHAPPQTSLSFQHPHGSWVSWPIDTTRLPPVGPMNESYSPSVIPRTPITATTPSSLHSPQHADYELFNKGTHDSDAEEVCMAKYGKPCSCTACKQAILGLQKYQLNQSATRV